MDMVPSGVSFTKGLWACDWKLMEIMLDLILILMIQSTDNFAHVMTAELSWHVQNCQLIGSL